MDLTKTVRPSFKRAAQPTNKTPSARPRFRNAASGKAQDDTQTRANTDPKLKPTHLHRSPPGLGPTGTLRQTKDVEHGWER